MRIWEWLLQRPECVAFSACWKSLNWPWVTALAPAGTCGEPGQRAWTRAAGAWGGAPYPRQGAPPAPHSRFCTRAHHSRDGPCPKGAPAHPFCQNRRQHRRQLAVSDPLPSSPRPPHICPVTGTPLLPTLSVAPLGALGEPTFEAARLLNICHRGIRGSAPGRGRPAAQSQEPPPETPMHMEATMQKDSLGRNPVGRRQPTPRRRNRCAEAQAPVRGADAPSAGGGDYLAVPEQAPFTKSDCRLFAFPTAVGNRRRTPFLSRIRRPTPRKNHHHVRQEGRRKEC